MLTHKGGEGREGAQNVFERLVRDESGAVPIGAAFGELLIGVVALVAIAVIWRSLRLGSFNAPAAAFWFTVLSGCAVGSYAAWKLQAREFGEVAMMGALGNGACAFVYAVVLVVDALARGAFGVGTLLLAFVAVPALVMAAGVPLLLVQSAVIWALRRQG